MQKLALITGVSGAIGAAIAQVFKNVGYETCGIDLKNPNSANIDRFFSADLNEFATDESCRKKLITQIKEWVGPGTLQVLINNAAYQYVSTNHPIDPQEFMRSHNVNVLAPYLLIASLADLMSNSTGSVVNIGSIHSRLTKPGFIAYSTSKAALSALTRGLAIDYADRFRINCIEPAAVSTPMLIDGFKNCPDKLQELEHYHPQLRISTPEEIAQIVLQICSSDIRFLHGACIDVSGGISSRLHDPA